ncbi:hypothetical protein HMPREF9057_00524 [Actinomyces sp. oral taxon 171 str. F0337]|nr:hypothetical protein HMPREF9057_00524 [Actinomyces sp. oral taxon 171 str. F0337]
MPQHYGQTRRRERPDHAEAPHHHLEETYKECRVTPPPDRTR